MRLLPAPFRDDLGRRVPAAVVTKEVLALVDADWKRRRALPELRQERWRGGVLQGMLPVLAGCVVIPLLLIASELTSSPYQWVVYMALPTGPLLVVLLRPQLQRIDPPMSPARTRQRFLDALLCASCAHDLKGLPPRADGITVCPECGAAWRVEGTQGQRDTGTKGMGE